MQAALSFVATNPLALAGAAGAYAVAYQLRQHEADKQRERVMQQQPTYAKLEVPRQEWGAVPHPPKLRHTEPPNKVLDDIPAITGTVRHQIEQVTEPTQTIGGLPRDMVEAQAVENAVRAAGPAAGHEVIEAVVASEPDPDRAAFRRHALQHHLALLLEREGTNREVEISAASALRERMGGSLMRRMDSQKRFCPSPTSCYTPQSSLQRIEEESARRVAFQAQQFKMPDPMKLDGLHPRERNMPTREPIDVARQVLNKGTVPVIPQTAENKLAMDRPGASSLTDMQNSEGFSWAQRSRTAEAQRKAGLMTRRAAHGTTSFCDVIRPKPCGCAGGLCPHQRSMQVPQHMQHISGGTPARVRVGLQY